MSTIADSRTRAGTVVGVAVAVLAAGLAYRGHVGRGRRRVTPDRGVHVVESVRVERTPEDVYQFWRRLENLPLFMDYLQSVTDLGEGRSRWVAEGPAGVSVEWDAEIVDEVTNRLLAWRSLPGADVASAGSVVFDAIRDGRATEVKVQMQYGPPAGRLGDRLAQVMWRSPRQTIREDLRRLKQILEAGELTSAGNTVVHGGDR